MKNILVFGFISLFLFGCLATAADLSTTATVSPVAESRWVIGAETTLKSEAVATSSDILSLPVGMQIRVLETSGRWLKVQTLSGEMGWVFAGRLSSTPPTPEVMATNDLFAASAQQSQIDVARTDSARSIRGLSAETENYAQQRGTPQEFRKALDKILARHVNKDEVKAFMRAGKLGEYAE